MVAQQPDVTGFVFSTTFLFQVSDQHILKYLKKNILHEAKAGRKDKEDFKTSNNFMCTFLRFRKKKDPKQVVVVVVHSVNQ